jgi:hypothetical protein
MGEIVKKAVEGSRVDFPDIGCCRAPPADSYVTRALAAFHSRVTLEQHINDIGLVLSAKPQSVKHQTDQKAQNTHLAAGCSVKNLGLKK